jgi:hypothetical protein
MTDLCNQRIDYSRSGICDAEVLFKQQVVHGEKAPKWTNPLGESIII